MNPFFGYDEENFSIWSLNYDLLVNFDPEDLSPVAGHRRELGGLRGPQDGHLQAREGTEVVRRQADHLRGRQVVAGDARRRGSAVHRLHRQRHLDRRHRTSTRSSSRRRSPTRGSSAACSSTSCPSTSGARCRSRTYGSYEPELPIVGSGPYIVTEYERGRIVTMDQNPEWRGEPQPFDQLEFIKYGTQDAVERALQPRRGRLRPRGRVGELRAARRAGGHHRPELAVPVLHRSSRSTSARRSSARTASATPRCRIRPCGRRSPTRSTASG